MTTRGDRKNTRNRKRAQQKTSMFSYYRSSSSEEEVKRSPFNKKPGKKKSQNRFFVRFVDVTAAVSLLVLVIYCILLNSPPTIEISDNSYNSKAEYENAVVEELSNIKNQNKLTFNEEEVVNSLKTKFPELSVVEVELPFFGRSAILKLNVSQPAFALDSRGEEYVVDSKGSIAGLKKDLPSVSNLPTVIDESEFVVEIGRQILSQDSVMFINDILVQSKKSKVKIRSLNLPVQGQELHMRTVGDQYYTKFFLGGDPSEQIGQWLAARKYFAQEKINPEQYLDVRVGGKIFYR